MIKHAGQVSTIMRLITSEDGDPSSWSYKINEKNKDNTSLKQILFNNNEMDVNKGKIEGQLSLEPIFGFCRTFKKTIKNLGFHISLNIRNCWSTTFHIYYISWR